MVVSWRIMAFFRAVVGWSLLAASATAMFNWSVSLDQPASINSRFSSVDESHLKLNSG